MFCLRNQDITDAKAFFYLFFMSNSGYDKAREYMQELKKREDNLLESLPSTYEYLKHLHSRK